jgi:hypothetical protein
MTDIARPRHFASNNTCRTRVGELETFTKKQ